MQPHKEVPDEVIDVLRFFEDRRLSISSSGETGSIYMNRLFDGC
jgi:hypothetical protein